MSVRRYYYIEQIGRKKQIVSTVLDLSNPGETIKKIQKIKSAKGFVRFLNDKDKNLLQTAMIEMAMSNAGYRQDEYSEICKN